MNSSSCVDEGKKEACKTYLEQTKLLVTLASAFLFAPAGLVAILKEKRDVQISASEINWFFIVEVLFVASVLVGYVVLGSIAGSQDSSRFDVYRPATRLLSLAQFGLYVLGMCAFVFLAYQLVSSPHP